MRYLYAMLAFALALFTAACSDNTPPPRVVYVDRPVPVYTASPMSNTEYVQTAPAQQPVYAAVHPTTQGTTASQDNQTAQSSGSGVGTALVVGALAGAATSAAVSHVMNNQAKESSRYVPTPPSSTYTAKPAASYKPVSIASLTKPTVAKPSIDLTKPVVSAPKPSSTSIWSRSSNDRAKPPTPSRSSMFSRSSSTSRSSLSSFSRRR